MPIQIAPDVEHGLGPETTALIRVRTSFASVECYVCGEEALPDSQDTALSLLILRNQQPLTLFSHVPRCAPSRVLSRGDLDSAALPVVLAHILSLQDQETHWNYMQVELVLEDMHLSPALGPGNLTRQQAKAGILTVLDRAASRNPQAAKAAAFWRAAKTEDLVYAGQFLWCVYEYPAGQDPRVGALGFLHMSMPVLRELGFGGDLPRAPADW
ncbi:hypothetical protein [Streptomyces niveus]|uniref:hypothetical protein n=1 Tax=Streptomyces niveus TaxID=193462 RepID=UPI00343219B1